jgi:carbonic anhydrase
MQINWRRQMSQAPAEVEIDVAIEPGPGSNLGSWSYEGATGPDYWAELDAGYAACRIGSFQSPIALSTYRAPVFGSLRFDYRAITPIRIVNDGITVNVSGVPSCSIQLDGERYELLQLHFHHPAEHTLDGARLDVEIHFVHRSAAGKFAVIGILARSGMEHEVLTAFLPGLPQVANMDVVIGGLFYPEDLFPPGRAYARYLGSRTMPPCDEGVEWLVMSEPIELSPDQIAAVTAACPANARPLQPLNGRAVTYGVPGHMSGNGQ